VSKADKYRIVFYGASEDKPDLKAKIELYSAPSGETAHSMGRIRFYEGPLPSDSKEKKGGDFTMNLPTSMFGDVVDLLRNEIPVYFSFHEGRAVLGTANEPIGSRDETRPKLVQVVSEADPPPPKESPPPSQQT
jgi:hypothetical protein